MDEQLIGWWKVQSISMPERKVLSLIGGLPGERVGFSDSGHYLIGPQAGNAQLYRTAPSEPYPHLDIWIQGLESLTSLCIYSIEAHQLTITVAGRPSRYTQAILRPSEMRMDELLNWAVVEMVRCRPPRRSRSPQQDLK